MIPKIIHYCWLSGDAKPASIQKCMKSWAKYFPDYEIRCWDSSSFDFDSVPFVKEAYARRKWAFVADYLRLYALYNYGGIYLDSDVEAYGEIDEWLGYDFFTGLETRTKAHDEFFIEGAILGCCKGNAFIKECLDLYSSRSFIVDGEMDMTPIPTILSPLAEDKLGWIPKNETQHLSGNSVVFSLDYIANSNCVRGNDLRLYHWNNRSWLPLSPKARFLRFLKNAGLKEFMMKLKLLR